MELTIQQSDLVFGAGRALSAVPSKSTQPVLNCVLLEADATGLRITGTDLEITASVHIPCAVKRQGRAAVSARHFHEVVRKLTKGEVSLAMADGQCEVRYGGGKGWSRFPTQDPIDFPRIPEFKAEATLTLEGEALSRLLQRTSYAAAVEEMRQMLQGVLIQAADGKVTFVATDGHRLARASRKGSFGALRSEGVIVPSKAVTAVSRAAEDATSAVTLEIAPGKNQASFTTQVGAQRVTILTRLLEGPYPSYEQVIPKSTSTELKVPRADLIQAVDIVASHADNVTRQVRFSLRANRLGVSSATELGSGEHHLDAEYSGSDMEIGYNAGYVLDILRSIPTEQVLFRLNNPLSAGVVEPVGALPQAEDELLCLIMPLRLPDATA
jgi:DNA polymerase-3 subunit beta